MQQFTGMFEIDECALHNKSSKGDDDSFTLTQNLRQKLLSRYSMVPNRRSKGLFGQNLAGSSVTNLRDDDAPF